MIFWTALLNHLLMKEMEVSLGIPKTFLHNSCVSVLLHDLHTALLRGFQNQIQSHLWLLTDVIQHCIMIILSKLSNKLIKILVGSLKL